MDYKKKHGIVPKTIKKEVRDSVKATYEEDIKADNNIDIKKGESIEEAIDRLTEEMLSFARNYEFEKAANRRDFIKDLKDMKQCKEYSIKTMLFYLDKNVIIIDKYEYI